MADPPGKLLQVEASDLDFGEAWTEPAFAWKVRVHNPTRRDAELTDFVASCPCVTVTNRPLLVRAGEGAEVCLAVDLTKLVCTGCAGTDAPPQEVTFRVTPLLGVERVPQATWVLRGRVRPSVTFNPPVCTLWDGLVHGRPYPVTKVAVSHYAALHSVEARCDPTRASVRVSPNEGAAGSTLEIALNPRLPRGPFAFEVLVTPTLSDGRRLPEIPLKVEGEIGDPVLCHPAFLDFGRLAVGESRAETVTLELPDRTPFAVTGAESTALQVTAEPAAGGSESRRPYRVSCRPSGEGPVSSQVRFTLRTAAGVEQTYSLPVAAYGVPAGG